VHEHLDHANAGFGPLSSAIRPGQGSRDVYMHTMIGEVTRERHLDKLPRARAHFVMRGTSFR
jgi:hypothetical protein